MTVSLPQEMFKKAEKLAKEEIALEANSLEKLCGSIWLAVRDGKR